MLPACLPFPIHLSEESALGQTESLDFENEFSEEEFERKSLSQGRLDPYNEELKGRRRKLSKLNMKEDFYLVLDLFSLAFHFFFPVGLERELLEHQLQNERKVDLRVQ